MKGATMGWEKVASVTPGGQPYFYVCFPTIQGKRRKITIVWDRNYARWTVEYDDFEHLLIPTEIGYYRTAQQAMAFVSLTNVEMIHRVAVERGTRK